MKLEEIERDEAMMNSLDPDSDEYWDIICKIDGDYRDRIKYLLSLVRRYREGIMELIAYGMPKHIEDGLIELLREQP